MNVGSFDKKIWNQLPLATLKVSSSITQLVLKMAVSVKSSGGGNCTHQNTFNDAFPQFSFREFPFWWSVLGTLSMILLQQPKCVLLLLSSLAIMEQLHWWAAWFRHCLGGNCKPAAALVVLSGWIWASMKDFQRKLQCDCSGGGKLEAPNTFCWV